MSSNGAMSFQAVSEILASRQAPLKVFFRDDDGGWADERLQELATDFIRQQLPLDVAVIPDALNDDSISLISSLLDADGQVAIHQHGFCHVNHQLSGRSCEFGSDRNLVQQQRDIALGKEILVASFGNRIDPIFTPPWNRCTTDTTEALQSLDFKVLSRIVNSDLLGGTVPEVPVTVDWLKKRKGVRLHSAELIEYIVSLLNTDAEAMGVMLHHEHMDEENRALLFEFIEALKMSPAVSFHSMIAVATMAEKNYE